MDMDIDKPTPILQSVCFQASMAHMSIDMTIHKTIPEF